MRALLPRDDLDLVLSHTGSFWSRFAGARLLVTGGTGFVGRWLVESVQHANDRLDSRIALVVLTRDAQRAARQRPEVFGRADTQLVAGDIGTELAPVGAFDLCIHAATDVGDSLRPADPLKVYDSIVDGTRRMLDLALEAGCKRFLLTSSGAVYGTQPPEIEALAESYAGAPSPMDPKAAYGNGKRAAEWLAAAYAAQAVAGGFAACSARIFALLGPGLPLDGAFAAGNFIRDALAGKAIRVQGDGRPLRSYLYTADLAVWLLRMLEAGAPGAAYNVGSQHAISIAELAHAVATASQADALQPRLRGDDGRPSVIPAKAGTQGSLPVEILAPPIPGTPAPRYVPDTRKAREDLSLSEYTPLPVALAKTLAFCR